MPRPLKTPFAEGLRRIGKPLIEETGRMFDWWHRVRDGTLSRASFRVYMRSLSARVEALLAEGIERGDEKTARTCAKLLKAKVALWTFVPLGHSSKSFTSYSFVALSTSMLSPPLGAVAQRLLVFPTTIPAGRAPRLQRGVPPRPSART